MSTHVALVARAFGADEILVSGDEDSSLVKSVGAVVRHWGGGFRVRACKDWLKELESAKARGVCIVHLTMYGQMVQDVIADVKKKGDCLVVVGSQKVPIEVYRLADYNVSVTTQPHSEVAALAIFLDRFFDGKELAAKVDGGKKIIPSKIGKNVIS